MNLAEEFILLAYADDGRAELDSTRLDHGLGGSLLLDLALAERVDVRDKRVIVRSRYPLADPVLDEALARIAGDDQERKPGHWVQKFADGARDRVLAGLVEREILAVERDKVLWIFPRTRYASAGGRQPAEETAARARMREAVLGDGPVESRTAALCALVAATDLDGKIFADLDRKRVKARLTEIGEGAWAAAAVKKTIQEVQAAVMIAIMAATTASTASST